MGETLPFAKDPFSFLVEKGQTYGSIFRTKLLGRNVICLSGADAMEQFLDPDKISRQGAQLGHVQKLFGGVNMGGMDGAEHLAIKTLTLTAFGRSALTSYVPELDRMLGEALQEWAAEEEFSGVERLRQLAIEAICTNVLGITSREEVAVLRKHYQRVSAGMISVPVRLPGTTYSRAHGARRQIFEVFEALIADRRAHPREDGISRILAAKTAEGRQITDAELLLEVHHMIIAGYIVFGLMVELLIQLENNSELRQSLLAELDEHGVDTNPSLEQLYGLSLMRDVVREAKRTAPIVPMIFGVAKQSFEVEGYTIPEGWNVWMALGLCNVDERSFAEPKRFDPSRYQEPRSEHLAHPHAWMPQGSGPKTGHRCLGVEYSEMLCQVFLVRLLRGYRWEIPKDQDLSYLYKLLPPEPKDGLRIRLSALP